MARDYMQNKRPVRYIRYFRSSQCRNPNRRLLSPASICSIRTERGRADLQGRIYKPEELEF